MSRATTPCHDTTAWRRRLHRHAELSGQEAKTAEIVDELLGGFAPDKAIRGLGGHGSAYIFEGHEPGPTVLLRCDLDALPIPESIELEYASLTPGVSHKCGHDGHMAILISVASSLAASRPEKGRAVLLFQPAEETGEGAAKVIADPKFNEIRPDFAVALHNLPGRPLGQVTVRNGIFNCASVGLLVRFSGETSHAAEPESARNPAAALAHLLTELPALAPPLGEGALLTVTHASLGEATLGITPGHGVLMATLRAASDRTLGELVGRSKELIASTATESRVGFTVEECEPFRAVGNACELVGRVAEAARDLGLAVEDLEEPLRWSEDFAEFSHLCPSVLFGLGSGREQPPLHHSTYDFPDDLIPMGSRLLRHILDSWLSS